MLYSLQTVWPSRRLPEGDPLFFKNADYSFSVYCKEDEYLDSQLRELHKLSIQGFPVQPYIDTYLPAVAFVQEQPLRQSIARRLVLGLPDSPQLGSLPDLCRGIRSMFTAPCHTCSQCSMGVLHRVLPLHNINKTNHQPEECTDPDPQVMICVLLGLLLGLYPKVVRFPPFPVRVALYRRVHSLITSGDVQKLLKCPMLINLAFMEYCAHVIPAYMPVEEELLLGEPGMAAFFTGCSLVCDAFRQGVLVTGEEDWQVMAKIWFVMEGI